MKIIRVNTQNPYDVVYASGELDRVGEYIKNARGISRALIVSDVNVAGLYLGQVKASMKKYGFECVDFIFEAGEQSKTPKTFLNIVSALADNLFSREDLVVALGGGVVGDIAGYAASSYMRGIDVVQIPTTLLAALDSSIGGKTGVDLPQGKNLLGAFHQPKLVFFDDETLKTLSETDWKNGLGESVKYAVLEGGRIAEILAQGLNRDNLSEFVSLCGLAKITTVEADEKEGGKRKLLNLGHTLGHSIEKLSGYVLPHGLAVAEGIRYMCRAAVGASELKEADARFICSLLDKYKLTSELKYTNADMCRYALSDKKRTKDNGIEIVKIYGVGDCRIEKLSLGQFENYINNILPTE